MEMLAPGACRNKKCILAAADKAAAKLTFTPNSSPPPKA
jgi:hypothetical protein